MVETVCFIIERIHEEKAKQCVSVQQVVDNKKIVNSYQPLNRQFRRKELVGKLL